MLSLRIILEPTSVQMVVLGKRTLRILDRRVVRPGFLPVLKNAPIQVHVLVLDVGVRGNAPALESFRDILRLQSQRGRGTAPSQHVEVVGMVDVAARPLKNASL